MCPTEDPSGEECRFPPTPFSSFYMPLPHQLFKTAVGDAGAPWQAWDPSNPAKRVISRHCICPSPALLAPALLLSMHGLSSEIPKQILLCSLELTSL